MKRCSISLIIRGMHIKATMRYHITPVRMVIIKKTTNDKCGQGCGENGTLVYCWWECKLVQSLWRTVWRFFKKLNIEVPHACSVASVVSNSWWHYGLSPVRLLSPRGSPGKNTGVGCHDFLQEIFLSQGLNSQLLHLLHWQGGSLPLAPPEKSWVSLWSEGELDSTRKRWSLKSSPASSKDRKPSNAKEAYSLYSILA